MIRPSRLNPGPRQPTSRAMPANRASSTTATGEPPLRLGYHPVPAAFSVAVGVGAGVLICFVPVAKPRDRILFVGLALIDLVLSAYLAWYMAIRIVVDDRGIERRRPGRGPVRLAWGDVVRVTTWMGESVRLVGREGAPTIWVSSGLDGFRHFLDRLEGRPEYDLWVRGKVDPSESGPGLTALLPRRGPSIGLAVAAVGLWTLAIVFLLRPDLFRPLRADDPRGDLFNLVFIDHPALGQAAIALLAFGATYASLAAWQTLRVEHDGVELESLLGTRSIPFDGVAGLDVTVDRGHLTARVASFDHVLRLRLADGRVVTLLRGEKAKRAGDAIGRAFDAWRALGGATGREPGGSPSALVRDQIESTGRRRRGPA